MTKQNNGWISVEERLPEERQTVLIAIKNGRDYYISMATYQKHYEKMKQIEPNYDYYGIEEVTLDLNQVEYWQPLPQPPTITAPSQIESVGINLIAQERQRQQSEKGFTLKSDTQYANDELVKAAMCYLKAQSQHAIMPGIWPWGKIHWKPKDRKRNLIKAGALIAAEIDRLHNTTP